MSNFIKMNYVAQRETSARVINPNSNPIMAKKEREWAKSDSDQPETEEEFEEGIQAPTVDLGAMAEETLAEARAQAEEILNEANAAAQQARMDAQQEAKALFEDQKAAGYAEGKREAEGYLAEQQQNLENQLTAEKQAMEEEYRKRYQTMESEIVDALGTVLERTFGVLIQDHKDVLLTLIDHAILNLETGKTFKIRVCPDNFKFIQNALPQLTEKVGSDVTIDVQNDAKLGPEDCIIETDYGLYQCGIDVQLENLITKMRALSV